MLVTPKALLPLLLLALPALGEEGIFDCLTGPCVTVEGVGKIQGSWQKTQWTNRRIYQFMGIPFGETTGGEHRSLACPPPHSFAKKCSIGLSLFLLLWEYFPKVWSTTTEGSFERWQRCVWRLLLQLHHQLVEPCLPSSWDLTWWRVRQSSACSGSTRSRVERHHAIARCVTTFNVLQLIGGPTPAFPCALLCSPLFFLPKANPHFVGIARACQSSSPPPPPRQPPPGLPGAVMGSEDCLHLAVHTPQLPSTSHKPRLPVMVTFLTITFNIDVNLHIIDNPCLLWWGTFTILNTMNFEIDFLCLSNMWQVYIHGGTFVMGGYMGAGPKTFNTFCT